MYYYWKLVGVNREETDLIGTARSERERERERESDK